MEANQEMLVKKLHDAECKPRGNRKYGGLRTPATRARAKADAPAAMKELAAYYHAAIDHFEADTGEVEAACANATLQSLKECGLLDQ
ncbi:MAG: hypothetical protein PHC80_08505 [Eubacteriales bacterium]|nr:hypothetical protein [Eubacteriales bacterium]